MVLGKEAMLKDALEIANVGEMINMPPTMRCRDGTGILIVKSHTVRQ